MCGIFGIWRRDGENPDDARRLATMADVLYHRGPDDWGYLQLNTRNGKHVLGQDTRTAPLRCNLLLGSRRLAVMDTSSRGRQPMVNEARNLFLVFNGEIYNHAELRSELESMGYRFHSRSDTEVVLYAYEAWGEEFVKRLNGMWAIVLWDQHRHRLIYCRDRFGIKPLYVADIDGVFYFASEAKAIRAVLEFRPDPDYVSIAEYVTTGHLGSHNRSFFEGIHSVQPSRLTVCTSDGKRSCPYWCYTDQSEGYDFKDATAQFRNLLADSVGRCLEADRPVGLLLSGGLDSTTIAVLGKGQQTAGRHAFTATFPGFPSLDEYDHAGMVAAENGLKLHCLEYRPVDFMDDLERVCQALDAPPPRGQVMVRYHLLKLASEYVTVVLEGQGADEQLGGYMGMCFRHYAKDELGDMAPGNIFGALRRLMEAMLVANGNRSLLALPGSIRVSRNHALKDGFRLPLHLRALSPFLRGKLGERLLESPGENGEISGFPDRLADNLYRQHADYILPTLLNYGDRMSMAHAVESRVPYLDHRLVEFLFALPYSDKIRGKHSKVILRRAMKGRLPESILNQTDKFGFDTPMSHWLCPQMETMVKPVLLSRQSRERGILDQQTLVKILRRAGQGDQGCVRSTYRYLGLETWFRQQVDTAPPVNFRVAASAA
jgi:asparagine synthase (glutamine-hydrolysing)